MPAGDFKVGAVLDWDQFPFEGRESKDKLLVVLGAKAGHDFLLVLATSQRHHRSFNPGCHLKEGYFFIPGTEKDFFTKDTWLILAEPQIASAAEIVAPSMKGSVRVIGNLREQLANAIRNCLGRIKDVSQVHLDLL